MTDAPKRIFAWREDQGDMWTGEWCPADEAEFVPKGAWEMVPATELAAALAENEAMRAALERLGSAEGMKSWGMISDNSEGLELKARMAFARAALASAPERKDGE